MSTHTFNTLGNIEILLPISNKLLEFSRPRGRTLDQIALYARDSKGVSEVGFMLSQAALLCVSEDLNVVQMMDTWDAEDVLEVITALTNFRVFNKAD